jgi:hypothetical protein
MRTLQKTFSLQTVLLLSTALLSTLSANSAFATYYKKQSYSHCGSSSQSNVCNSPLGEYTYDLVDDKVTQTNQTNNSFVQIDGLNIGYVRINCC